MHFYTVCLSSRVEHSAEKVFNWYLCPAAFERLVPPWEKIKTLSIEGDPGEIGSHIVFKLKVGLFWKRLVFEHQEFIEGKSFTDIQCDGPFKFWKHIHRVNPVGTNVCEIEDVIHFSPPFGLFRKWIEKKLKKMLRWRHETLINDLRVQTRYPSAPMRILISGSSGLVGRGLTPFLRTCGHEVVRLVRRRKKMREDTIYWEPGKEDIDLEALEDFDVIIHLAGKNISSGLWTKRHKHEIALSRCRDTALLSQSLAKLKQPPKVFVGASAIGIYGDRKDEEITEESSLGEGFLADVCKGWEEASSILTSKQVRRVITRFGLILSTKGGLLARLLPIFRLGLGMVVGNGKQTMSYISLDDVVYAMYHCILNETVEGAVNFTTSDFETNRSFSEKLAAALHQSLSFSIGEKALRRLLGEMADEMLLTSIRAKPEKLRSSGYLFFYPKLDDVFMRHFF